jgi:hypothetical protein
MNSVPKQKGSRFQADERSTEKLSAALHMK